MNDSNLNAIGQIENFLEGVKDVEFRTESINEKYKWIQKMLIRFEYIALNKNDKGMLFKYVQKMTGYSRQQISRLIYQYKKKGFIERNLFNRYKFPRKYSEYDIKLLVKTDNLHRRLSGPATKKILEREYLIYRNEAYKNIANISSAHIYNFRENKYYKKNALFLTGTKPTAINIGERSAPRPYGRPGYIRVDSVHQGDLDGEKGLYHIDTVDEVTQFQIVAAVERINEACLIPVLIQILEQYPFTIIQFHSDNGSEFINHKVAALLNSLLIKLTKSRPRRSNDNALVESKNGAVIRKHLGYAHIPQKYAKKINEFYLNYFNEYINFHRPCFFPKSIISPKGKCKKIYTYENMMTPYEKLKSIPNAESFLKKHFTFEVLDDISLKMSDNIAAERMVNAQSNLFKKILDQV